MKFLLYMFGIYIVALSIMPCSDASNDCNSEMPYRIQVAGHDHKDDTRDVCTPFCTCTCCRTITGSKTAFRIAELLKPIEATSIAYPFGNFSFVSNYYGNIWQPPKISA